MGKMAFLPKIGHFTGFYCAYTGTAFSLANSQINPELLATKEFENYSWLENYKNAFFKVNVDSSVKSGMLITET